MLSSIIERLKKKSQRRISNQKTITLIFPIFLISFLLILLIAPVRAYDIIIDNNVDADSDIDSIVNIGVNDSTYLNAQTLDGIDQVIQEDNGLEDYELQWEHQAQNIDIHKDDYELTIYGYDPEQNESEYLELKKSSEHYHFSNGSIRYSSRAGDQNTWNGSAYEYYIWNEIEKSVQYANSTIRFYDWFSSVEIDDKIVVDDGRWIVEYWREQGGGDWGVLDLYNHVWFEPIVKSKSIEFIQGYDDGINFMNVSYLVRNQASVKISLNFISGETREVRFVWSLSGMDGSLDLDLSSRIFSFADIIFSCNDTELDIDFSYNWVLENKKLDLIIGNYTVDIGSEVFIDPTFSEKQETDSRDHSTRVNEPDRDTYIADVGLDFMRGGWLVSGAYLQVKGKIAWDTGITDSISSTSNVVMTFYCSAESIEADEYLALGLYDKGDDDEYWNETENNADPESCHNQEYYYKNDSWYVFDGLSGTNITIGDESSGIYLDEWVTHHNGDSNGRQYIAFGIQNGTGLEWNSQDYVYLKESSEATASERPTLTFTYTLGIDSENISLQIWDWSGSEWDDLGVNITDTEQWYNVSFDKSYVDTTNEWVTWRYVDTNTGFDDIQNTLYIDYAGIRSANFSIYGLPAIFDSLEFSPDSSYHAFTDSPLSFVVESGKTYDVQIMGTDNTGTSVADGFIYYNTVDDTGTSIALTTSYVIFYNDQSAGNNTHYIYIWVNWGWSGGDSGVTDGTRSFDIDIQIINA